MTKKNLLPGLMIFLLMALLMPASATERSPFESSPKQRNLHNYTRASKNCRIAGLITTKTQSRVILKLNNDPQTLVFREGDTIRLLYRGIGHDFRISAIKAKSVMLTGKNNKTYEMKAR